METTQHLSEKRQKEIKRKDRINKLKHIFLGVQDQNGLLYKLIMYILLSVLGFVFVYPLIYMFSVSMMSNNDLIDVTIKWIPSGFHTRNYSFAYRALDYFETLWTSVWYSAFNTFGVLLSSAFVGYGISRFRFPGRKVIVVLILLTFVMPNAALFIQSYQIMSKLKLTGGIWAIFLPAVSGQGLQAALFILIFVQFFNMIPKSLEEAAIVDGANSFKIFYRIAIPIAVPAIIITSVYAFTLYWNETFLASTYLEGSIRTFPMRLQNLRNLYYGLQPGSEYNNMEVRYTEALAFAGTILSIIPLIVMYAFVQKWFVESIDKTGITGE